MPLAGLLSLLIAVSFVFGCSSKTSGQATDDGILQPARPVPTHVLSREQSGAVVEAEVGDRIEVRLQDLQLPKRWESQGDKGLEVDGPPEGLLQVGEKGPRRVFQYLAQEVGRFELSFTLRDPESVNPPELRLEFTIAVH